MYRVTPALDYEIKPALAIKESVRVDLPWSTWAITDMFRILSGLSIILRSYSTLKFTILFLIRFIQNRHF